MKKSLYLAVAIFCIALMIISTGCDFLDAISNISCESSTNIEVAVQINAKVIGAAYKPGGETYEVLYPNVKVEFQISKTGGDSFTQYRTSGSDGYTDSTNVGYNLRKGQKITVKATTTVTGTPATGTLTYDYEEQKPLNASKGVSSKVTWADTITLRIPASDSELYPAPDVVGK
jgi:hypothetical protein